MKTYFYLQCKRVLKTLPLVLCVLLLLFGALLAAYTGLTAYLSDSTSTHKFKVALSGSTDEPFLEMGLQALQAFDSTRFAVEIVSMEEPEAAEALARGDVAAYVVVPEGFMEAAMHGEILPLKYVSTNGAASLVSLFKDEITRLISDILTACEKGAYGVGDALKAQGYSSQAYDAMNELSIQYVEFVFVRSGTYRVQELGIGDGLGLEGYLMCGLSVLFLLLACLPFAPVWIRRDPSLGRMLSAKGKSVLGQVVCEFGAFLLGMAALLAVVLALASLGLDTAMLVKIALGALPAVVTVAALSFLLYELSGDLISGVLLQFFVTLAMGFISGCMYPVFFFPETVQKIAAWLPTGMARSFLASCVTGTPNTGSLAGLLGYSAVFFAVTCLARWRKVTRVRG